MTVVALREFDCIDCGRRIWRPIVGGPPKCAECTCIPGWQNNPELRAILDPEFREDGTPPKA